MRKAQNSTYCLWAVLALPSIPMVAGLLSGTTDIENLVHQTGEFSARFMIVAMAISPLRLLFSKSNWTMWLLRHRRNIGVAAFCYALAHTFSYIVDMNSLDAMLDEFFALGIWTGWVALAIFLPLGLTSNDLSQRLMLSWWKPLQRWVYLAALFVLIHWSFVHNNLGVALIHAAPLILLELIRIWKSWTFRRSSSATQSP